MACNCESGVGPETIANLMSSISRKFEELEERVAELERFQTIVMDEVLKNVMRLLDDRDTRGTK